MIIRRKHNSNFTVIPNRIVNDDKLSLEAMGLLTYLLTRPDHWEVNAQQLAKHFQIGKNKTYALINLLMDSGYIEREQARKEGSRQFSCCNYVVYDTADCREITDPSPNDNTPQSGFETPDEPCHGNGETASNSESRTPKAVSRKQGRIVRTELVNSLRKEAANAGASAPSETSQIWKEGKELLKQSPSQANPSIIGKWLKRVPTAEGKEKLRAMMRAAVNAGTADPVSYVTAALATEFPPLPDYRKFDAATWERNQRAAIKTKSWSEAWGPPPERKGCAMPQHLVTSELNAALSARKIAA